MLTEPDATNATDFVLDNSNQKMRLNDYAIFYKPVTTPEIKSYTHFYPQLVKISSIMRINHCTVSYLSTNEHTEGGYNFHFIVNGGILNKIPNSMEYIHDFPEEWLYEILLNKNFETLEEIHKFLTKKE